MIIDKRREEYLESSRYKKMESDIFQELDIALANLQDPDITMRKKAAKRLSWNSRRETFYSVRVWFLQDKIIEELFDRIVEESDEKIKVVLVKTLYFFYSRYIKVGHWDWNKDEKIVNETYIKMLLNFVHDLTDTASIEVLFEIAIILLFLEDNSGWDIYAKALAKQNNKVVIDWFSSSYSRYGDTITLEQKVKLIDVLSNIIKKSKNNIIVQDASYVKSDLLLRNGDNKGWDVYADTLENQNCITLIEDLKKSCILYADKTMSVEQSIRLSTVLTETIRNCKDNYVEGIQNYVTSCSKEALDICNKIKILKTNSIKNGA